MAAPARAADILAQGALGAKDDVTSVALHGVAAGQGKRKLAEKTPPGHDWHAMQHIGLSLGLGIPMRSEDMDFVAALPQFFYQPAVVTFRAAAELYKPMLDQANF